MTVREYMGARYVPVFMGDWDVNADYEPLSIVNYQGNSYTSRQAVPHGVEITNTAYWAVTGNYNAQIEAYRQEVLQYNGRISTLESDLPIVDFDSVNTVKKYIDDAIDSIDAKSEGFNGAHGLFFGDSWGTTGSYGVDTPFFMIMATKLGFAQMENLCSGGSGFCKATTHLTKMQNWIANTAHDPNDVDYVFLQGSCNDAEYTEAEIKAAVQNAVAYANANFPNAVVYLIPTIGNTDLARGSVSRTNNMWVHTHVSVIKAYNEISTRKCRLISGCLNVFAGLSTLTYFNSDYTHPKQAGHNYLANQFAGKLCGNPFKHICNADDGFELFRSSTNTYDGTIANASRDNRFVAFVVDDVVSISTQTSCTQSEATTSQYLIFRTPFGSNAAYYGNFPMVTGTKSGNTFHPQCVTNLGINSGNAASNVSKADTVQNSTRLIIFDAGSAENVTLKQLLTPTITLDLVNVI